MKKINRITLLLVICVLLLTLVTGCAKETAGEIESADTPEEVEQTSNEETTDETSDEITLTTWGWDNNYFIYMIDEAAKLYSEDHPNVTVNNVYKESNEIETMIVTAATSGQTENLPDISFMQDNSVRKMMINYPELFVDLTDSGINFDDFAGYKVANNTVDGKIWAIPIDTGVAIFAYRSDILESCGYTREDLTDITWTRFIEIGEDVLAQTGMPLLSALRGGWDFPMLMLHSAGVWFFDEEGNPYITDNEALLEAVDVYVDMVEKGILVEGNDWEQFVSPINTGSVAGVIEGAWIMGTIQNAEDQAGNWAITNIPRLETVDTATNYGNSLGTSAVVFATSKNLDTALDFVRSTIAGSPELYGTILERSGLISTYLPASQNEEYQIEHEYFGGQQVFIDITDYASKVPEVEFSIYNLEAASAVANAITEIINGADKEEALKQAEETLSFQMGQ